jgi:hypothetical protein
VNRDQLIEAGARAFCRNRNTNEDAWVAWASDMGAFLDAIEPLIRADERALIGVYKGLDMSQIEARIKANGERIRDAAQAAVLVDLRAKVEALPRWSPEGQTGDPHFRDWVPIKTVLALIDGGQR